MDIQDLRTIVPGGVLSVDLCIVGSGPVGLTLAAELAGADIAILESGGRSPDVWADSLNAIESVGARRVTDQTLVRNRGFGGTSRTWSGRVAAFDDTDFVARAWVPESGWPFSRAEVARFLPRTLPYLGGSVADNLDPAFKAAILGDRRGRLDFDVDLLEDYLWSYSRDASRPRDFMRFGPRAAASPAAGVRAFVNATVTHLDTTEDGGTMTGIEVTGADGRVRSFSAGATILCAGGLENARLLLASNRRVRCGVGNASDQVGRYLMDHPRGPVARFDRNDSETVQRAFGLYRRRLDGATTVMTRGVALSRSVQERQELLNCSAWIGGTLAEHDPFLALSRVARLRGDTKSDLTAMMRGVGLFASGARRVLLDGRSPLRAYESLDFECMVEQRPDPDSRLTLSDRVDALGVALSRIDWRVGEQEGRTVRAMARIFIGEARRLGLPVPRLLPEIEDDAEPLRLPDVAHPMGTTRMSVDPRRGVVDVNCAVHGVRGLYAVGGSVFPTGGHANPTQTALALAIRLADHLKGSLPHGRPEQKAAGSRGQTDAIPLGPAVAAPAAPILASASFDRRVRVLVTGAGGRVGSRLTRLLVERGYAVRALTSRLRPTATPDDGIEWVVHDLRQADLDFSRDLEGCQAVLHLGAELRHPEDMYRTNVEATRALARAAEAAGVRFMCYVSTVSIYGSGFDAEACEDGAVLTADRDVRAEYWGDPALRTYGRTKLQGEMALSDEAHDVEYVIFRPTVIVDVPDVAAVIRWSVPRRALLAYRNAHHIYVLDVVEALIWAMERSLARDEPRPGITTYNLSDETLPDPTFGSLLREAYTALDHKPFKPVPALPGWIDWGKEWARYRGGLRPRRMLGLMRFPSDRLTADGFRLPHGMASVRRTAVSSLASMDSEVG